MSQLHRIQCRDSLRWGLMCLLASLVAVAAPRAAGQPQAVVETFARFDREITTLWPGEDGDILVEASGRHGGAKGKLWIVNRKGDVTWEFDGHEGMPPGLLGSDVGWGPDRVLLVLGPTGPPNTIPGPPRRARCLLMSEPGKPREVTLWVGNNTNWLRPLRVILALSAAASPRAMDEQGRRLPNWDVPRWKHPRVDFAVVEGKPLVAISSDLESPHRLMLFEAETGRLLRRWDLGDNWAGGRPCISPQTGLVALFGVNEYREDRYLELRLYPIHGDAEPDSYVFQEPVSLFRSLSPGGTRLALWNGPNCGVFDLQSRRLQWAAYFVRGSRSYWSHRFRGVACDDEGRAVAVMGHHRQPDAIDVYFFDPEGDRRLLWRSPDDAHYASPQNGTPLVVDWQRRQALVRYRNEIVAIALPEPSSAAGEVR